MVRRIIQRGNRTLLRPCANELKRFFASSLNWPQTFVVDRYGEFSFRAANSTEVGRTLDYGLEVSSLAAFLFLIRDEDIVWDIGASIGLFTVHTAARAARVVAFEPDPATFRRLKENVSLTGLQSKVEFLELALGNVPGQMELAPDGLDDLAPALSTGKPGRHKHAVAVRIETIDGLISQGVSPPTVIKMDIEGAELLALRGAVELLRGKLRPRLLFIEVHPQFLPDFDSTAKDVTDLLAGAEYRILASPQRGMQYHLIAFAG